MALAMLVVLGVVVAIALGVSAVGSLVRQDGRRARSQALLAALMVSAPVIAAKSAERLNHWVDADSNDLLDPLSNGSYDWFDVNAGKTALIWGLLNVPLLVAWLVTSREGGST